MFCFTAAGGDLPTRARLGELPQEGFGQCRVYTLPEMEALGHVRRGSVDAPERKAPGARARALEQALIVQAARREMARYVRKYYTECCRSGKWPCSGLNGRLRLMLAEAANYPDFLRRIDSIKPSD